MNLNEAMQELESYGTEQTRKTYARHGVRGEQFGVLTSNMKMLVKKIKQDHALAVQLWETRNHDARVLASMIIDPAQVTEEQADRWVLDLRNYVETDCFANIIAKTPFVIPKMEAWVKSDDEWIGYAGWQLLGHLAYDDMTLPDSFFEPYLKLIERDIHIGKNRVSHGMNNVLIGLGVRNEALRQKAEASAQRIGKVVVDHGETGCKTPDAIPCMEKIRAHREKKA